MRIYISGPISGDPEYLGKFKLAQSELEAEGYSVINPAELVKVIPDGDWAGYMSICKHILLCFADYLYQLPGWETSKGAQIEYRLAKQHGIKVMERNRGQ